MCCRAIKGARRLLWPRRFVDVPEGCEISRTDVRGRSVFFCCLMYFLESARIGVQGSGGELCTGGSTRSHQSIPDQSVKLARHPAESPTDATTVSLISLITRNFPSSRFVLYLDVNSNTNASYPKIHLVVHERHIQKRVCLWLHELRLLNPCTQTCGREYCCSAMEPYRASRPQQKIVYVLFLSLHFSTAVCPQSSRKQRDPKHSGDLLRVGGSIYPA